MEYLKRYNISEEQIIRLKERYNEGIIEFLSENREFIEEKLNILQKDGFVLLYEMLENNVKIFLETTISLEEKIQKMKQRKLNKKVMQMILLTTELYDKV